MMSGFLPCNGSHRVLLQQHEWPWNLTKKSGEPKKHLLCTWKTNPKKKIPCYRNVTGYASKTHIIRIKQNIIRIKKNILSGSKKLFWEREGRKEGRTDGRTDEKKEGRKEGRKLEGTKAGTKEAGRNQGWKPWKEGRKQGRMQGKQQIRKVAASPRCKGHVYPASWVDLLCAELRPSLEHTGTSCAELYAQLCTGLTRTAISWVCNPSAGVLMFVPSHIGMALPCLPSLMSRSASHCASRNMRACAHVWSTLLHLEFATFCWHLDVCAFTHRYGTAMPTLPNE